MERKGPSSLLLVDVSNHAWRAAAAHPQLTSRRAFTGGLYGFFTTVAKILRETAATRVVFGCDARPYVRSREYPAYKTLRKERQDDGLKDLAHETIDLVLDALRACNLPVWRAPGFEYDDLVGHAVARERHRFGRIWAASNDSDLFQLLPVCDRFAVYRGSGLADAMRAARFAELYPGVGREEWVLMQALQGTHNDIEGIRGVGLKTAYKIVTEPGALRAYRERHGALIERNVRLIELPHRDFPARLQLPRPSRPFDMRELYRFLATYDIDTTPSIERAFRQAAGD